MKKILLLNFNQRNKGRLEAALSELGEDFSLKEISDPKQLELSGLKVHSVFYLHDKGADKLEATVKGLREAQRNIPINVIFKKKDFTSLLKAHELSLSGALPKKYLPGDLKKSLEKADLGSVEIDESNLPVKELLDLLSSPIKVKVDRDLYRQLYKYFKGFSKNIEFSLYRFEEGKRQLVEGPEIKNDRLFKAIENFKLPKLFIGKVVEAPCPDGRASKAFPVYEEKGVETWCLCSVDKDEADYALNSVFFRWLENILIFRKNLSRVEEFTDLANKDDVTGLYNQRKLVADLAETIELHEEMNKNFSIMFIDVDHFKKVNDNFGHIVGSQMLTEIGVELTDVLRSSDKIYRYGGDEFVVLMPEVDINTVHKIAVRVRETVKQKYFNVGEAKNYQLSLSIGIAEYPTDAKTANEIIEFADSMMYVSKKSGRGKVFHVGEVQDDAVGAE